MSNREPPDLTSPLDIEHYQALLGAAMEAIILVDERYKIIIFNPAAEMMFGYKSNEVLNQSLDLLIPEDQRSNHRRHIENYAKLGDSKRQPGEYLTVHGRQATGDIFPARACISRISIQQHTYLSVFLHDLTAEQLARDKIEDSDNRFAALLSNLPGIVYRYKIHAPWRVEFISDGIQQLTGHSAQEFLNTGGVNIVDFIHPEDLATVEHFVAKGIKDLNHYEIQYRLIDRYGTERWVQEKGICQYDKTGNPVFLDGFILDITQQKQTELLLEAANQDLEQRVQQRTMEVITSHQMLDAVFDNSHVSIAILDTHMNFIRVNRAYACADGKSPDYFVGKNHFTLFPNSENEALFYGAVTKGELVNCYAKPFEYRHNPERGLTHWDWTLTPIKNSDGNVVQLVLALMDVSTRINALEALGDKERQLRAMNKSLEQRVQERTAELASAHEFTEAIVDTVGALVVVMDTQGKIIRFNRACEITSEYDADEVLGLCVWDFLLPPEVRETVIGVFNSLTVGDFPNSHQNHWQTKSGELRLIDWNNSCLTDITGKVTHVIATGIDITEKTEAQRLLQEKETHLRTIAENSQRSYYLNQVDPVKIIYTSPNSEEIYGIPLDRLQNEGQSWIENTHEDDLERVLHVYQEWIKKTNASFDVEYRIRHPTKGVRWIRASGSWITNDPSMENCYGGITEDITLRKNTELALRESEEQFRILAENIHDVFWLISPERDKLWYISPAFETVWGRPMTEILDNPKWLLETVHPDDRAQLIQEHTQQLNGDYEEHYEREFRILRPNGEIRWIVSRYSPIRNNQNEVYRIAGLSEDITERKVAEHQRLEHERQQRDTLVREVHHRIKNNLQGVVGLLRQSTDDQPDLRESVDAAVSQVSTMALVHGLQSNNRNEQIVLCDLCDAISRSIIGITGASIQPIVTRKLLAPVSLRQEEAVPIALILNELIFNAVKHQTTEVEQAIHINIDLHGERIVITVRNKGKPLPKGIDIKNNTHLGVGLTLVRTLLPKCAHVDLIQQSDTIITTLHLNQTLVELPEGLLEVVTT